MHRAFATCAPGLRHGARCAIGNATLCVGGRFASELAGISARVPPGEAGTSHCLLVDADARPQGAVVVVVVEAWRRRRQLRACGVRERARALYSRLCFENAVPSSRRATVFWSGLPTNSVFVLTETSQLVGGGNVTLEVGTREGAFVLARKCVRVQDSTSSVTATAMGVRGVVARAGKPASVRALAARLRNTKSALIVWPYKDASVSVRYYRGAH